MVAAASLCLMPDEASKKTIGIFACCKSGVFVSFDIKNPFVYENKKEGVGCLHVKSNFN